MPTQLEVPTGTKTDPTVLSKGNWDAVTAIGADPSMFVVYRSAGISTVVNAAGITELEHPNIANADWVAQSQFDSLLMSETDHRAEIQNPGVYVCQASIEVASVGHNYQVEWRVYDAFTLNPTNDTERVLGGYHLNGASLGITKFTISTIAIIPAASFVSPRYLGMTGIVKPGQLGTAVTVTQWGVYSTGYVT